MANRQFRQGLGTKIKSIGTSDERGLMATEPNKEVEELLEFWFNRANEREKLNYGAANIYVAWHYALGIPVLLLTAVAASDLFTNLARTATGRMALAISILRVLVPVLAGLQTFMNLSERAEKHRKIAANYGSIKRQIKELLAFHRDQISEFEKATTDLRAKIDALALEEPSVPRYIFTRTHPQPEKDLLPKREG